MLFLHAYKTFTKKDHILEHMSFDDLINQTSPKSEECIFPP